MGLGPPVCMDCMLVMDHDQDREGWKWFCEECGKDTGEREGVKNLWTLNDVDSKEVETNSYGKWVSKEYREKRKPK